jgi:hypothetical protein
MYTKNTLSMLRQTLVRQKAIEDQVHQALEPVEPSLRFIVELKAIYQEVYGGETVTDASAETPVETKREMKPKTKKEVLFSKPIVTLPTGATWHDVTISFKNSEDVEVKYKDTVIGRYSHQDLGFAQENTEWKKPDRCWALLTLFAAAGALKPEIVITKDHLMHVCEAKNQNTVEKQKSDLSKGLRSALGIQDEPFERYTHEEGYRPKFTLLPEKDLRGNGELHTGGISFEDEIYNDN